MKANQLEQQAKFRGIPISTHQNTPKQAKLADLSIYRTTTGLFDLQAPTTGLFDYQRNQQQAPTKQTVNHINLTYFDFFSLNYKRISTFFFLLTTNVFRHLPKPPFFLSFFFPQCEISTRQNNTRQNATKQNAIQLQTTTYPNSKTYPISISISNSKRRLETQFQNSRI